MAGSVALKLRTKLQAIFFTLGCFSQRFSWTVLAIGFFILIGFSVGLLTARIETDVEKLWVEVDGRLEKELQYTKDSLGEGSGTTNELLIHASNNGKGNILSVGSLQEHLRAVQKAIEVKVTIYNKTWSHSDLCYVPEVPSFNDSLVDGIVSSIIPCLIISPLDCFWDGAKVLKLRGVLPDIVRNFPLEWTKIQPSSLLSLLPLLQIEGEDEITELFFKAGIIDGYQNRPCLDPTELDCPTTAPNSPSKSGQPPNVGIELTGGCKGFATELMEWAEELVVGGTKKATNGTLSSAKALQTILVLSGPQDLHKRWADKSQDLTVDWNIDSARKVLEAWQRSFTEEINKDVNNQDEFSIMAFDSASVTDLLQEFSQTSVTRIAIGYILMLIYAGLSLKRWCNAVHSHGSLGFAGVLLVTLSVAAGLGFCALVGISFNAASTQAAVVVIFNFIGVIIIFPAMISLDLRRRKIERYDILCCLKRSKEVVRPVQVLSADDLSTPNRQSSASSKTELSSNQVTVTPTQTIVMSVLANDKSESSVADVLVNEYLSNDEKQSKGTYSSQSSVAGNHVDVNTMQITALPKNSTNPKGNSQVNDISCSRLSLEYFATTYYGPALQQTPVKLVVLVLFSGLLAAGIYGAFQVEDGLELTEVVPQGSIAHQFVEAQFKYFSFYPMALVTQDDFDYPNQQSKLYSYHNAFKEIPNVIRIPDSVEIPKFWMMFFREWLEDIQSAFNQDWANNGITYSGWYENASDNGIIGFKLLSQAGNGGTIDKSKVRNFTLVSDDGIIRPELFYKALTVWIDRDVLGYAFSQAEIRPETQDWTNIRTPQDDAAMQVPTAKPITFAKINLNVIGLRETKDFVSLIKNVRAICDKFSADGLPNYPSGVPFTFWEQYIGLREQILLAIGISLGVSFVVVSAMLFNIWAAAVIVFTLTMITVELYGFMGLAGIQLSAVPAVTLILSVGVGVEFTVHMCMAFLYTPGNRNERMLSSVKHVFAPIVDGAISTFLGVVMLAGSPFQFIVRYFFNLLVALILIGSFNGLLFLPVLLSIAGPGAVAQEINTTGASHSLKFENQGAVGSSAESAISTLGAEETEMSAMKPAYNKRGTGHGSTLERTVQTTRHRAQVDPNGSGTNDACHGTCEQSSATAFDAKL
ncbi:protein patched homolog 1-like isoform X2 [Montipora capricornis]|uniref:protein patched homolog 1-like isoform X2 n=1 Tax=Montipora capricornis TaxID=246305 RepID=UPI0035F1501F